MESSELMVMATVFVIVLVAVGKAALWKKPQKKKAPSKDNRWRAFQVQLGMLYDRKKSEGFAIKEVPKGIKLRCTEKNADERHFVFADGEGAKRVKMSRGMLFSRNRVQVQLDGRHFLTAHLPAGDGQRVKLDFARGEERYVLQGKPEKREFELRKQERLVAIVSHQATAALDDVGNGYRVEVLKGEPTLRPLTVVLAVEAALGNPGFE
jgi:hypothetical protein